VSPGISAMQREICRAHGFSPDHHQFQILGLCQDCLANSPDS
jgi:Fe2+ or Zn2+ uptake regulation protein